MDEYGDSVTEKDIIRNALVQVSGLGLKTNDDEVKYAGSNHWGSCRIAL